MQTPQSDFPWLPVLAIVGSLLGGGMMGSIVTLLVTNYRNRRQPIGFSTEIVDVFKQNPELPSLRAMLQFALPEETEVFGSMMLANLSIIRVKVTNKGNQDFAEFRMGITLEDETEAFNVKIESSDRHHLGEVLTPIAYENPTNELDFALKPFNRGDPYTINVHVTYKKAVGPIKLSTAHSTKFVEISSLNETTKRERAVYTFTLFLLGFVGVSAEIISHRLSAGFSLQPLLVSIALVVGFAGLIFVANLLVWKNKERLPWN